MKFLIGLLILLFVLTTIGFSGTAYATECKNEFTEKYPRQESFDQNVEVEFYGNTTFYYENQKNYRLNEWNEFQSQESGSEFNYNDIY